MELSKYAKMLILALACLGLTACPGRRSNTQGPVANPSPTSKNDDGSSSGGGSFGDESSLTILRWAADDLSMQILNSSPEIYKNLPAGWTREKLAQIIHDVEPTPQHRETYNIPEVSRYGQRLMFNYGTRADKTPFITATKLFVETYAHYEVNSKPKQDFRTAIAEIKLKLAHEAAHLMNLGLTKETDMAEARRFARALLTSLDTDNIECLPKSYLPAEAYPPLEADAILHPTGVPVNSDESPQTIQKRAQEYLQDRTQAYVLNRPSGRAAQPHNFKAQCQDMGVVRRCRDDEEVQKYSSGVVDVFAPRDYSAKFDLLSVMKTLQTGERSYALPGKNYFSFNLIDLRKPVLTDEGYRSDYKYEHENDEGKLKGFGDYLDYKVLRSSAETVEFESYPALMQERWNYYRSAGRSRLIVNFKDGQVSDAKMVIVHDWRNWFEEGKTSPEINLEVPLTCVRSFKPLP